MKGNLKFDHNLELLRCVAIVFVLAIHSSGYVEGFDYGSSEYYLGFSLRCIVSSGVPLFLMISGALMLDKHRAWTKESLWLFYKRRFIKVVIPFLIFSFVHFYFFQNSERNYLMALIYSEPGIFLWYVYMICIIYFFVPFFCNVRLTMGLFVFLQLVLFMNIQPGYLYTGPFRMQGFIYLYYFFMGGFIYKNKNNIKDYIIQTPRLLGGAFLLVVMIDVILLTTGLIKRLPDYFSLPFALCFFIAVLLVDIKKNNMLVSMTAKFSYPIYLAHGPLILYLWQHPLSNNYILSTFLNILVTFTSCFILILMLSKIPVINKYIGI